MLGLLRDFVVDEAGTTAVDYGLVVVILVAAVFSALAALGDEFPNFVTHVGCMFDGQGSCGPS